MMRTPEGGQLVVHPKHIEEIRSAKEIDLHNLPANNELMQLRHTMHPLLEVDQYHFQVVQKQLTQSLGPGLPAIVDECMGAFRAQIGLPNDWKSVHMCSASFRIVTRTANRLLLGKELCANEEFLTLAVEYSDIFFGGANLIRHYPEWMKPWVMYFKTDIRRQQGIAKKHLAPLIKQRLAAREEAKRQGREAEFEKTKPSDTLQWVLDITPPEKMDINMLVIRLLHILVAAVHTSSVTFLNSMYDLALHPEIHEELRQEIRDVFASTNGEWTKPGLTKLMKLDSFIKESARFHPFQAGTMDRIAMRDYTLKDGTFIPKGTYMLTPSSAANFDPAVWGPDALEFDPWRFQKMRAQPGQETLHSLVQTSPKFTFFGYVPVPS
ncbi:cytochrome P450 [Aspergillus navahoensis]